MREIKIESRRRSRMMPANWVLTDDLRSWAAEKTPDVDIEWETEYMRDHEFSDPHSMWDAAWRNWMRRVQKRLDEKKRDRPKILQESAWVCKYAPQHREQMWPDNSVVCRFCGDELKPAPDRLGLHWYEQVSPLRNRKG